MRNTVISSTKYFVARQWCKGNQFHGRLNTFIYANNNKKGTIVAFPWQRLLRECITV